MTGGNTIPALVDPTRAAPHLRRLGVARIAIGVLFLVRTTPLLFLFPGLVAHHGGPLFGWPSPGWDVAYAGLVLPRLVIEALCVIRTVSAALFTIGLATRPAGLVAAACGYAVYAQEPFTFIFTLHVLYLATALLAMTDARSAFALRPVPPESPRSSVLLVRAFLVSIYAWSAIGKMHASWLDGSTLEALYADGHAVGPIADALFTRPHLRVAAAWGTVIVEAALGPLLLARRTRAAGVLVACILHALFEITLHPDVFGWVAVALLVVFFPLRTAEQAARVT
jgi:hypothetical protein